MTKHGSADSINFLPDFCTVRVLFLVLISAELLAIVLSLNEAIYSREILYSLAMNSLFIQWIALSCVGLLCMFRRLLNSLSESQAALTSYALILLVTFTITELAWWILYVYPDRSNVMSQGHGIFLLRSLGIAAVIGGIVLRYLYVQHEWRKNVEAVASSQLQALQSRIRPHFLFNCMNTIASLTRTAPEKAEQSVEDLAELFRASLLEPTNLYPIREELGLCQLYLRIEGHRLGQRLQTDWQIDALPNDALIPPLCLQPLLENSIYHGIERLAEGGTIEVVGKLDGQQLVLSVSNPLPEADSLASHQGNKHAQENIKQRLLNIYGDVSQLKIENDSKTYTVSLIMPYQTYEDTDR